MKKTLNRTLISALAVAFAVVGTSVVNAENTDLSIKEKAQALLTGFETGDRKPVSYINPNKYIQHNLRVEDGLEGFKKILALPAEGIKVNIKRTFQDGDYVFMHVEYDFSGSRAGFDIFRFENDSIVEHWDNLQDVVKETASGRTQTDGPTEVTDLDKTAENKALIKALMDEVFIAGKTDTVTKYISAETYDQHNPYVADGLAALDKAFAEMAAAGTPLLYAKTHIILGEGNFVLAVSEGLSSGKNAAFYDLFRIENGLVVEHWDTEEIIPARAEWKNSNGKFGFTETHK